MPFRWPYTRARKGRPRGSTRRWGRSFYDAAQAGRLFGSWTTQNQTGNAELEADLQVMRARSRELAKNNDFAKRYLRLLDQNVVGPRGIELQARVIRKNGQLDQTASDEIERGWRAWSKRGSPTVCGRHSLQSLQRLLMRGLARDGEDLVRFLQSPRRFTLQVMEPDMLEEDRNEVRILEPSRFHMGVEVDAFDRPIAYHIRAAHPGDNTQIRGAGRATRMDARDFLHIFDPDRSTSWRGAPWMHSAMTRLDQLGGYEEAELTAARVSSAKMGFITEDAGDDYTAEEQDDGSLEIEVAPATFERLPRGVKVEAWDPEHPVTAYPDFVKSNLRGVASGLGISYNALANDLEGVNFSSIRHGALDERDFYRMLQSLLVQQFLQPVFERWLVWGIATGSLDLNFERVPQYIDGVQWHARGWQWVDPQKEVTANEKAVKLGVKSRTRVAREQGFAFSEVLEELAEEEEMASETGVSIAGGGDGVAAPAAAADPDD